MTKPLDLLERSYRSFINLEAPRDFFIGMADYLDYLRSIPEFKTILLILLEQCQHAEDEVEKLRPTAITGLENLKTEIRVYVTSQKKQDLPTLKALSAFDAIISGANFPKKNSVPTLIEKLKDALRPLSHKESDKEFVSRFQAVLDYNDSNLGREVFPLRVVETYLEAKAEFEKKYAIELWGSMDWIYQQYEIIKQGENRQKELFQSLKTQWNQKTARELQCSDFLWQEWKSIQENPRSYAQFFDPKKVKPSLTRFQNHLLKEVASYPKKTKKKIQGRGSNEKEWYEKPAGILLLAVIGGIIVTGVVFWLGWK
jgi:hypothetical protein